jgi:hypothetical protein
MGFKAIKIKKIFLDNNLIKMNYTAIPCLSGQDIITQRDASTL